MFTDEFKKACEGCKSEEELKAVIELHKSELTDEELRQVSGGVPAFFFMGNEKNPFDLKHKCGFTWDNTMTHTVTGKEYVMKIL